MVKVSPDQATTDEAHMRRCLELARPHAGRTAPNPIVGCVIVDARGRVIAEGAHAGPGTPHAEIIALTKLGMKATGATLYTNLEPCNHTGRTPPCAPVVRASGVARVVIGTADPIREHAGGSALLRRAKIRVTTGVLAAACERANLGFFRAASGRPAYTLKAAMTLDGKIATVGGNSKWITGEAARADVLQLRNTHDAVMVGIGTVLADDPWLTCHAVAGFRDPHRIVLDSKLRTPPDARLLAKLGKLPKRVRARTIVLCGPAAPAAREKALVAAGAEVIRTRTHASGAIDLHAVGRVLAQQDLQSILVEGGGQVHAYMLDKDLVDQLVLYMAPLAVGGPAKSWVGGAGRASLAKAWRFTFDDVVARLGADFRFTAVPTPRKESPQDDASFYMWDD